MDNDINRLLQAFQLGSVPKELAEGIAKEMGYIIWKDSKGVYAKREIK